MSGASVTRKAALAHKIVGSRLNRAKALGGGNLSQGIRWAVASLPNDAEKDESGTTAAQEKGEGK